MSKRWKKQDREAIGTLIEEIAKLCVWLIILPFMIIAGIIKIIKKRKNNNTNWAQIQITPANYKRKYLLTHNEWAFYKHLKPIADKLGLTVLAKIRMADLVDPIGDTGSEYYKAFGKVKAKHVDFALAKPDNLYIELLIELDDSTHKEGNERDAFVENVYAAVGYKLLRVYNDYMLEEYIRMALEGHNIVVPHN